MKPFKKMFVFLISAIMMLGAIAACDNPSVPKIALNKTTLSLEVGVTEKLVATLDDSSETIKWTSSAVATATVDDEGNVKALAVGNATITAKVGTVTATCAVTVTPSTKSLAFTYTTLPLKVDEVYKVVVESSGLTEDITWESSDPTLFTVDSDGTITTLLKIGSGTVKAKANGLEATATVNVSRRPVEMTLNASVKTITYNIGEQTFQIVPTIKYQIDPETLSWQNSDPTVVSFNESTGTVTALALGESIISATIGNVTRTCEIRVRDAALLMLDNEEEIAEFEIGIAFTKQLTAVPNFEQEGEYTWESLNEDVATVDEDGVVTAIGNGSTLIVATFKYMSGQNEIVLDVDCTVSVIATGLSWVVASTPWAAESGVAGTPVVGFTVPVNGKQDLPVTANGPLGQLLWESANTDLATVDNFGAVRGVANGETTITVSIGTSSLTVPVIVKDDLVLTIVTPETIPQTVDGASAGNPNTTYTYTAPRLRHGYVINDPTALIRHGTNAYMTYGAAIFTYDYFYNADGTRTNNPFGESNLTASSQPLAVLVDKNDRIRFLYCPQKGQSYILGGQYYTGNGESGNGYNNMTYSGVARVENIIQPGEYVIFSGNSGRSSGFRNWGDGKLWRNDLGNAFGATVSCNIDLSPYMQITGNATPSIFISHSTLSVKAGTTFRIGAFANFGTEAYTWTSSNTEIATVDNGVGPTRGDVHGVAIGNATITVKSGDALVATCEVTVQRASFTINFAEGYDKTVVFGKTSSFEINATAIGTAEGDTFTWESSDTEIATVSGTSRDSDGKSTATVTILSEGKVNITMNASGPMAETISKTLILTIDPPYEVKIDRETANLLIGHELTLLPVLSEDAIRDISGGTYAWSSSNTEVATVNAATGVVCGVTVGKANITVTYTKGERVLTATSVITVQETASFSINNYDPTAGKSAAGVTGTVKSITVQLGGTKQLTYTTNVHGKTVTWASADAETVSVNASGVVTGVKKGASVLITASVTPTGGSEIKAYIYVFVVEEQLESISFKNPDGVEGAYIVPDYEFGFQINDNRLLRNGGNAAEIAKAGIFTYDYFYSGTNKATDRITENTFDLTNLGASYAAFAFIVGTDGKIRVIYDPVAGVVFYDGDTFKSGMDGKTNNTYLHEGNNRVENMILPGEYVVVAVNDGVANNADNYATSLRAFCDMNSKGFGLWRANTAGSNKLGTEVVLNGFDINDYLTVK